MKISYLFVLLALLLAGCRPSATTAPAAETPWPTTTELPASPTPAASSPALPTDAAAALPSSGIRAARLRDARRGWAIAGQRLFWTEDAGENWVEIRPPLEPDISPGSAFFLDHSRAWLLLCETQSADALLKIASTADAGGLWVIRELASGSEISSHADPMLCARTGAASLFFLDENHGWALVDHTETMNSFVAEMYRTSDGGESWQHLGSTPSGEFRFESVSDGWMRAACCTGAPSQLYRTQDGGASWQLQTIDGSGQDDDFFLPVFYAAGAGILPAVLRDEGVANRGISFFKTADGGASWSLAGALEPGTDALNLGAVFDVDALDERAWAAAIPGIGVFWTLDGGQSWRVNEAAGAIFELSLGSPASGWGLQCFEGASPDCVQLVRTEDSGATWLPAGSVP